MKSKSLFFVFITSLLFIFLILIFVDFNSNFRGSSIGYVLKSITGKAMSDGSMVNRTLSSSNVNSGSNVIVTLQVIINSGQEYYAIDEMIPSGFIILNPGTGNTSQSGHIKWIVVQNPISTSYSYTLRSPSPATTTKYFFSGFYIIEGMDSQEQIEGAKNISVLASCQITNGGVEICDGIDNNCNGQTDDGISPRSCSTNHVGICSVGSETCNVGIWAGCPAPQTEICNNNVDENCDGADLVCPCSLTNSYWSKTNATEGDIVTLTVNGSNCDEEQINFEIREDDGFGFYNNVTTQPANAVFLSGNVITTWTAEWQSDWGGLLNPPEYYFIATLVSNSNIKIDNSAGDLLEVYQKVVPIICTDIDGDGYKIEGGECGLIDCNDNNATINPGALELCNGINDNCANGVSDEIGVCPVVTYYCDSDNDGYISSANTTCNTFNCKPAACVTTIGNDCDDVLAAINPGATEFCLDSMDNDCDNLVDEADSDCSSDKDNDGVIDDSDCNDNSTSIGECVSCSICNTTTIGIRNGACVFGIPKPIMFKYENSITTNLTNKNLLNNISNFTIGIPNVSKIEFTEKVRLFRNISGVCEKLNFDDFVNISLGMVGIKSENLPELNKSAIITMYKINLISPYILIDGKKCTECNLISYSNNTSVFSVSHFSEYFVATSSITGKVIYEVRGCGDGVCDSAAGETCGATDNAPECNADCSTCPPPPGSSTSSSGSSSGGSSGGPPPVSKDFKLSTETISVKLTQGESKSVSFSITNKGDSSLDFNVSSALSEITFPESTFSIAKGESKAIDVNVNVDATKHYGIYIGKIYVKSGGITKEISISIEVVSTDSLFDVVLIIPNKYLSVLPGKKIISDITLTRIAGLTESNDVILTYTIINEFGDIIFSENEQKTIIETLTSINKEILIPEDEDYGKYILHVQLDYDGKVASSSQWFNLGTKSKLVGVIFWVIVVVIIFATAIIIYVIYLRKRAENYEIIKKGF